jgi:hypothetical protein
MLPMTNLSTEVVGYDLVVRVALVFPLHKPRRDCQNLSHGFRKEAAGIFHLIGSLFCGMVKQVFDGDESDGESPKDESAPTVKTDLNKGKPDQLKENGSLNVEKSLFERTISNSTPNSETPLSMGEILSSLDPGMSFAANGAEFPADKQPIKANGTHSHVKRNNLWGRSNVSNLLFDI